MDLHEHRRRMRSHQLSRTRSLFAHLHPNSRRRRQSWNHVKPTVWIGVCFLWLGSIFEIAFPDESPHNDQSWLVLGFTSFFPCTRHGSTCSWWLNDPTLLVSYNFLRFRTFNYPSHPSVIFSMRPHLLLSGRTVHPEIPEGDTPEEIALADKMREARELVSGSV